jgi:hypothetical protein
VVNIAVLIIGKSRSNCSSCGGNALVNEIRHETDGDNCGARFVATGSEYLEFEDHCRRIRPDLPYIDIHVNKGNAVELPRGFPL